MIFITKKMHQHSESGTKLAPNKNDDVVSFTLSLSITDKKKPAPFRVAGRF